MGAGGGTCKKSIVDHSAQLSQRLEKWKKLVITPTSQKPWGCWTSVCEGEKGRGSDAGLRQNRNTDCLPGPVARTSCSSGHTLTECSHAFGLGKDPRCPVRLGLFHWAEYQSGPGVFCINTYLHPQLQNWTLNCVHYLHQANSNHAGHYRTNQSSITLPSLSWSSPRSSAIAIASYSSSSSSNISGSSNPEPSQPESLSSL